MRRAALAATLIVLALPGAAMATVFTVTTTADTADGTTWLTQDRCDRTLTRMVRGKVSVRDFVKRKTVTLAAADRYTARRRR